MDVFRELLGENRPRYIRSALFPVPVKQYMTWRIWLGKNCERTIKLSYNYSINTARVYVDNIWHLIQSADRKAHLSLSVFN